MEMGACFLAVLVLVDVSTLHNFVQGCCRGTVKSTLCGGGRQGAIGCAVLRWAQAMLSVVHRVSLARTLSDSFVVMHYRHGSS